MRSHGSSRRTPTSPKTPSRKPSSAAGATCQGSVDGTKFEPWLRRLLLNSIAEEFRGRRRFQAKVRVLKLEPAIADAADELADRDELQRAFRSLSIDHRTIVVLHHYLGLSVDEAAATLGIPAGTAKSRLHYAIEALRATLDSDAREAWSRRLHA